MPSLIVAQALPVHCICDLDFFGALYQALLEPNRRPEGRRYKIFRANLG